MVQSGNPRILVVEDQEILRKLLTKALRKSGMEPIEAANGEKAIELYRAARPAVVLSDIMMPNIDGLTLLNEIKKIDKQAVVILMTGYGNEDILLKALRGGAANYFKKPFNLQEIIQVIQHLRQHQAEMDFSAVYSRHLIKETKHFVFSAQEAEVFPIINQITLHLQYIAPGSEILNLKVGIEEMLKNAVEHGCLGIDAEEKNRALEMGKFGKLIAERLKEGNNAQKKINLIAEITPTRFTVKIRDEGPGFDWRSLPEVHPESLLKYSGRGIFLTRIYFDRVIYNKKGNQVTLVKIREAENTSPAESSNQIKVSVSR